MATPETRTLVLSVYKQFLKQAKLMPTTIRRDYIRQKVRHEFREQRDLTDADEIDFQIRLAETNLETVEIQVEHLSKLLPYEEDDPVTK